MRSRSTVIQLSLVLTLSATALPQEAQAGFFKDKMKGLISFFKGNPREAPSTAEIKSDLVDQVSKLSAATREKAQNVFFEARPVSDFELGPERHARVRPEYRDTGLIFVLEYDSIARQNPALLLPSYLILEALHAQLSYYDENLLSNMKEKMGNSGTLSSSFNAEKMHGLAELLADAKVGNLAARYRLAQIEELLVRDVKFKETVNLSALNLTNQDLVALHAQSVEKIRILEPQAEAYLKQQEKKLLRWREETKILDFYEALPTKLNDLVVANDRKGVRQLLEAYLPWVLMQPTEAQAWKVWLEAIENPDRSRTILAFRGLDYKTDKIQRSQTHPGNVGFLSPVLTQNQGSYTRRLRSLLTNRIKNGDVFGGKQLAEESSTKDLNYSSMMGQFWSHSNRPVASSFLSFTYDFDVAISFAKLQALPDGRPQGALLAVEIDERRLLPNLASRYSGEIELLAPLIVFPDEVVGFQENFDLNLDREQIKRNFLEILSQKNGRSLDSILSDSKKTPQREIEYTQQGFKLLKLIISTDPQIHQCSGLFL